MTNGLLDLLQTIGPRESGALSFVTPSGLAAIVAVVMMTVVMTVTATNNDLPMGNWNRAGKNNDCQQTHQQDLHTCHDLSKTRNSLMTASKGWDAKRGGVVIPAVANGEQFATTFGGCVCGTAGRPRIVRCSFAPPWPGAQLEVTGLCVQKQVGS